MLPNNAATIYFLSMSILIIASILPCCSTFTPAPLLRQPLTRSQIKDPKFHQALRNIGYRHPNGFSASSSSSALASQLCFQVDSNYICDVSSLSSLSSSSLWVSLIDRDDFSIGPIFIVAVALALGIAAQSFINSMLKGDQGLGAFLQDGSGFQNSAYRPNRQKDPSSSQTEDPLPWLSLPKLDFVEVAGQEEEKAEKMMQVKLETLREEMNQKLQEGNMEEENATTERTCTLKSQGFSMEILFLFPCCTSTFRRRLIFWKLHTIHSFPLKTSVYRQAKSLIVETCKTPPKNGLARGNLKVFYRDFARALFQGMFDILETTYDSFTSTKKVLSCPG